MYDELFGLTGRPFQLTPDPAFWYETATHRRAMAYLGYGLAQGEGFIVITGDIGAGKTTLVGHLLDTLDREAVNPIKIVSTAIDAADLLRIVAGQFGVDPAGLEKAQLLTAIERGLHAVARTGRRTLLIVDEAQALPTAALEELRMLSNFQAGGHALLQIVLLGQPEFRAALHGSERLEQLRQRVIAIHHLDPMAPGEVAAYVRHRLNIVGWSGRPGFADSAFAALHRYSDGVPRRLNQLANRVMLHAAVEGVATVTAATIDHVAADLFADLPTMGQPVEHPAAALVEAASADEASVPVLEPAAVEPVPVVESAPVDEPMLVAALEAIEPAPIEEDLIDPPTAVDVTRAEPMPVDALAKPSEDAEAASPAAAETVADLHGDEPRMRPFRHAWLDAAERAEPPMAMVTEEPEPVEAAATDARATVSEVPAPVAIEPDAAFAERIAELEARMAEQDAALRRVLTLLVDWVEADEAPRPSFAPADAIVSDSSRGYAPIRGAAA